MSELHKFLFDGLPVRGMLVRLTDTWQDILARRAANTQGGAYPAPVRHMLGQMTAAAALMQANIKFNGSLTLQVSGDGPVKMAVIEVQPDLSLRATATVMGPVKDDASLSDMLNVRGRARCAITLDPKDRLPGQQPYQGVVPLLDADGSALNDLAQVIQHYMRQSEQLDTTLVLAANDEVAAGLWIQRLPVEGVGNLGASSIAEAQGNDDPDEPYRRVSTLAASLTPEELLGLDADTVLHRLFWEEAVTRFEPLRPRFACSCSRDRVARMIVGLGRPEVDSILAEQGGIEVGCDFCGQQYRFDPVDAVSLFTAGVAASPDAVQ